MENAEHLHASSSMDAEKKQINKQIGQIYQNTCTDIGMKILSARFRNFATWFFGGIVCIFGDEKWRQLLQSFVCSSKCGIFQSQNMNAHLNNEVNCFHFFSLWSKKNREKINRIDRSIQILIAWILINMEMVLLMLMVSVCACEHVCAPIRHTWYSFWERCVTGGKQEREITMIIIAFSRYAIYLGL